MKSGRRIVFLVTEDWYFCLHWLPVARAVRDAGFDVTIVTKVDRHAHVINQAGLTLVDFDLGRGRRNPVTEWRRLKRLTGLYRQLAPDLVHHIGMKSIALGSHAARLADVPASVNLFAGLGYLFATDRPAVRVLRTVLKPFFAFGLNRMGSRVETLNDDDRRRLEASGWIDPTMATVLPGSGLDLERFPALPPPEGPVVTLAVVARMLKIKGIDLIVNATRRVQTDGAACRLLLVGKPDPANPSSFTQADLERWGSLPGIEWRGHIDDVREIWKEADIAVLASHGGEGVPVSLMEASACCRPSIATNTPGCRDIVVDGKTGLLVEPNDESALANAMQVLIADRRKRLRFGLASRQLVSSKFTSDQVSRMILEDYRRLGLAP
ncbi:MAG: glycosyltransferase family 4 protein [Pseudomonadota bacterium]